ncbi:MAG: NIPSNAP family protein [Sedimentisphaerales bacterium]|nr:NIPSNAP family protein [Sedimentisphaerales bacterium]
MQRRDFLTASCLTGLAACGMGSGLAGAAESGKDFFELQKILFDDDSQTEAFYQYMAAAAIPALNRININPVGVFVPQDTANVVYILLRHRNLESVVTAGSKLLADAVYLKEGAEFLNAPAEARAFKRIESSLMAAFDGMPSLATPVKDAGRIFQLRIYESPSVKTGLKKIDMFNEGELEIFRKTGLHAVFFGQTLIGPLMPNLTYMLVFKDAQQQQDNWKAFVSHPDWQKMKAIPEYADKKILSNITNMVLKPADCSQI